MSENRLDQLRKLIKRNDEIFEAMESGEKPSEVASRFGVSPNVPVMVHDNYEQLKVSKETQLQYYLDIIELYKEDGLSVTGIADVMGTTKQNVSRILSVCGVSRDDGAKQKKIDDIVEKLKIACREWAKISKDIDLFDLEDVKKKIETVKERSMTVERFAETNGLKISRVRTLLSSDEFSEDELKLPTDKDVDGIILRAQVIDLRHAKGYTQVAIAEELQISQAYVSKILLDAGLRVRQTKDVYEERDAKILKDHADGMDVKELMLKYDLKEVNVRRILYKENE